MFLTDLPNIFCGPIISLGSQDDEINVPALWKHRLMFFCVVQESGKASWRRMYLN